MNANDVGFRYVRKPNGDLSVRLDGRTVGTIIHADGGGYRYVTSVSQRAGEIMATESDVKRSLEEVNQS